MEDKPPPYNPTAPGFPEAAQLNPPQQPAPINKPGATYVVTEVPEPQELGATTVIVARGPTCRACGVGPLVRKFTCGGIALAIIFWPIGMICCFMMRRTLCVRCGARF